MMATRSPIVCLALLNIIRTLTEHNAQHESHRGAAHTHTYTIESYKYEGRVVSAAFLDP